MVKKRSECLLFGRTVRSLRIKRGYFQEAFADAANMDRSYMGGIERGEFSPTISTVYRIAKALRVAPAKLFSNKPSSHEDQSKQAATRPVGENDSIYLSEQANEHKTSFLSPLHFEPSYFLDGLSRWWI